MKRVILFVVSHNHKAQILKRKFSISPVVDFIELENVVIHVKVLSDHHDINTFRGIECDAAYVEDCVHSMHQPILRGRVRAKGAYWDVFETQSFDSLEIMAELFEAGRYREADIRSKHG